MALYDPARHEPLTSTPWDEARARAAIAAILDDAHTAFTPEGLWPIHPFDRSDERPPDCLKPLYHGAAGVIWALHHLDRRGAAPSRRDWRAVAGNLIARNRQDLEIHPGVAAYMGGEQAAFLVGESGLLLLQFLLVRSDGAADALHVSLGRLIGDVRGLVWGGAGAMLAAIFMHEQTGEDRWTDQYGAHFDALWQSWTPDTVSGAWLWDQDLYGVKERRLGALHGFMANVTAMIRGRRLVEPDRFAQAQSRILQTIHATAVMEGSQANWPHAMVADPGPMLVQHCMGAPGMITGLAGLPPDAALDARLIQAGELVWAAGPPVKLPSLCHGAPGNGYAFLKLYARTGEAVWLARARGFAMHAIEQAERAMEQYGQRKFSLWTGDLGLAIYLWDCIEATAQFPTLDVF